MPHFAASQWPLRKKSQVSPSRRLPVKQGDVAAPTRWTERPGELPGCGVISRWWLENGCAVTLGETPASLVVFGPCGRAIPKSQPGVPGGGSQVQ